MYFLSACWCVDLSKNILLFVVHSDITGGIASERPKLLTAMKNNNCESPIKSLQWALAANKGGHSLMGEWVSIIWASNPPLWWTCKVVICMSSVETLAKTFLHWQKLRLIAGLCLLKLKWSGQWVKRCQSSCQGLFSGLVKQSRWNSGWSKFYGH